ncbi:MAG: DUF2905 family protein [Thermaerobacter sp.]|nr:DUF2905 domain-containing protein [Bacillota bacterium]REJ38252.1 MAG: DUF2905 domain-containing protein [Bacillota bacterium]
MPELSGLGRFLILAGLILAGLGLLLLLLGYLGLGRLPGDIVWRRGNFTFFFPLATSLLLSLILTLILNLILRR